MASSCDEGKLAALFTEAVSNYAEGELAIDETASTVSLARNNCVVPIFQLLCKKERSVSEIFRII